MKQCFNSFSRVFTNFCCLYFQAHPVSLPGYSEEVFHASLPAVSRCLLLLPFLSKAFSLFPKLLHSMTDLLPPVTMQAQTLKNPSVCAWRGSWNGCIPNVVTGKEKLHQGFFIRLGPDELRGRSVWWIQENLPRLLVFPEVRHTMSLEERKHRWSKVLVERASVGDGWPHTSLLMCRSTFSMVRCFWIRVRAFFGPKPGILSQ